VQEWRAEYEGVQHPKAVAMLALHARRSAASIEAWSQSYSGRGLGVVLTGTDLYRDIQTDASAQRSLELAHQLVVLQELGPAALPEPYRSKTRVIFQSTRSRKTGVKSAKQLRAVMVGHLRDEKSPQTLYEAARLLAGHPDIHIDHIGAALDTALGEQARQTQAQCANYRWFDGLEHEATRRRIQRAHVLVHCSRMEGGAHVLMEAVCSGTPVLASRIDGNVGMLGADYAGYFPWGDSAALAQALQRCQQEQRGHAQGTAGYLSHLQAQCSLRAPLFAPEVERAGLLALLAELVQ